MQIPTYTCRLGSIGDPIAPARNRGSVPQWSILGITPKNDPSPVDPGGSGINQGWTTLTNRGLRDQPGAPGSTAQESSRTFGPRCQCEAWYTSPGALPPMCDGTTGRIIRLGPLYGQEERGEQQGIPRGVSCPGMISPCPLPLLADPRLRVYW